MAKLGHDPTPHRHRAFTLLLARIFPFVRLQGNSAFERGEISMALGAYEAQLQVLDGRTGKFAGRAIVQRMCKMCCRHGFLGSRFEIMLSSCDATREQQC